MNRNQIFLYFYIILIIANVGLIYPLRQSSKEAFEMITKYEDIENEVNEFKSFDDSIAVNSNFRKQLLDTVSTFSELRQVRENQRNKLTKKLEEFTAQYPSREKVLMKYKMLDGLGKLLDVVFVCMTIPLIIYLFKRW